MQAPVDYRALLVSSSLANGAINALVAAYARLPVVAMANVVLMFTSVWWWWSTKNPTALRMDRTAAVSCYILHCGVIAYYHSVPVTVLWAYQGCMLVILSHYAAYVVKYYRLSFFVWFVFHCVQTRNNVQQYWVLRKSMGYL